MQTVRILMLHCDQAEIFEFLLLGNKACKNLMVFFFFFFFNAQLVNQCISMLYTEKSILRYYVRFSQICSHFIHLLKEFTLKLRKWSLTVNGCCMYICVHFYVLSCSQTRATSSYIRRYWYFVCVVYFFCLRVLLSPFFVK